MPLESFSFEVFGRVQGRLSITLRLITRTGVFFRKYTVKKANELAITGWVRNMAAGTVQGFAEGDQQHMAELY